MKAHSYTRVQCDRDRPKWREHVAPGVVTVIPMASERPIDHCYVLLLTPNHKTVFVVAMLTMLPTQLTHAAVSGCTGFVEARMLRTTAHP